MAWLDAWAALKRLEFRESVVASCQLRPPYKKESVHISYLLDSDALEVKCPGGHEHVKIQGQSAVYTHDIP